MPPIRTPKSTITAFFSPLAKPAAKPTPAPTRETETETASVSVSAPATAPAPAIASAPATSSATASATAPTPTPTNNDHAPLPKSRKLLPPSLAAHGPKEVTFYNNAQWEKRSKMLNRNMKKLVLAGDFTLTDQTIDDMVALGTQAWRQLTHFEFHYVNADYGSTNSASELTDQGVIRLAKLCPNLRVVQLQATFGLSDAALVAIFRNCPQLTSLELSGNWDIGIRGGLLTGSALDELRESPGWVPKLKTLRFTSVNRLESEKPFMKAVRALGKERPGLKIYIGRYDQVKIRGDWEITTVANLYVGGRVRH